MSDPIVIPTPPIRPSATDTWDRRMGIIFVTLMIFGDFTLSLLLAVRYPDLPPTALGLIETVKAVTMIAVGYWLGGSAKEQKQSDQNTTLGMALAGAAPPPVIAPPTTTVTTTTDPKKPDEPSTTVTTTKVEPSPAAPIVPPASPPPPSPPPPPAPEPKP